MKTRESRSIDLFRIEAKIELLFSRDLSTDRELLQLQRGASGDPPGYKAARDEVHRRRRRCFRAAVQDPMRKKDNDIPFGELGSEEVFRRGDLQGDHHYSRARRFGAEGPDPRRNRHLRSGGHHHCPRVDHHSPGIVVCIASRKIINETFFHKYYY